MLNKIIAATGVATVLSLCSIQGVSAADDTIKADQMRASKMIGTSVYDRDNRDLASIKDFILDKDGKVANVILSYGSTAGMGGKYVAVPFRDLKLDHNRLTLDETKAQLDKLPNFKVADENTGSGKGPDPATGGHAVGSGTSSPDKKQ
jgi:sporulation protein YlmC with PRC-barrel domain